MAGGKVYLGDGAYAEMIDGYQVKLTTEDGISVQNTIYLERPAFDRLKQLVEEEDK